MMSERTKLIVGLSSLGALLAALVVVGAVWLVQALPETRAELTRRPKGPPDFTPAFASIPWKRDPANPHLATVAFAQTPWNRLASLPGQEPLVLLEDPPKAGSRKNPQAGRAVAPLGPAALPWVRSAEHPARANVSTAQLPWKPARPAR